MKLVYFYWFILFVLLFNSFSVAAQSKKDLEKKRNSVNWKIKKTNTDIAKTKSAQKTTRAELAFLKQKLGNQEATIITINKHIDSINIRIDRKIEVVEQMELDLEKLKANYKKIIRQLYKYRLQRDFITFLLSAESFSRAYQRWIYLQYLSKQRAVQAQAIKQSQEDLAKYVSALTTEKATVNQLLDEKIGEKTALEDRQKEKSEKIQKLASKEKQLRAELSRQKSYKRQLSKRIEKIIQEQIAAARRAARRKEAQRKARAKKPKGPIVADRQPVLNKAFAAEKGKMMAPIYRGKVVVPFGKRKHPQFKDVYINNNGIDIEGQYNSVVRNIFEGKVVSIFAIPGMNNAIMVKHGDYFTTYSNVAKVYVKRGQELKKGAQLGTIGRGQKGTYILHFELWHNKVKQNPSIWIKS